MLSVKNVSDVAVYIKFDQGPQNWDENGMFTGDYSTAQFQRSRQKIFKKDPTLDFLWNL